MEKTLLEGMLEQVSLELTNFYPDDNCQVISGYLADALFMLVCGENLGDEALKDKGYEFIQYHMETAQDHVLNYKWAHGITGLSWALTSLVNQGFLEKSMLGEMNVIDDYIGKSLTYDFHLKSYDFAVGALGKAHFFLERDNEKGKYYIEKIIKYLDESAIHFNNNECFWIDYYTDNYKEFPQINLGLFHGQASIVYFLSKFYIKGICTSTCNKLITKSLNFLSGIYNKYNHVIPNKLWYVNDHFIKSFPTENIQGWCHGHLSGALAFYYGGCALRNEAWLETFKASVELSVRNYSISAEYGIEREPFFLLNSFGKTNITFCHGLIGNIFIFNKINEIFQLGFESYIEKHWEKKLYDTIMEEKKIKKEFFFHKGAIAGISGLGMLLLQQLNKDTLILERSFLLDLEYFADHLKPS